MEPTRGRVRPIHMGSGLKAAVVVLGCLLALAGCGSASSPSGSGSSGSKAEAGSTPSAKVGSCGASASQVQQAKQVTSLDVDGDGTADAVKLTSAGGTCPNTVFAKLAQGYVSAALPSDDPSPARIFGVRLSGHEGELLVAKQDHPRGGYQLHVFANGPDGLVELTDGDQPLVPFVATDTRPIPYTVDCQGRSIVVSEAVAKSNGGWDIRRTTYAVAGSVATRTRSVVDLGNLSPAEADQVMPVGAAVFPTCGGGKGRVIG